MTCSTVQEDVWCAAASALSGWFRRAARDLPWRESPDPYRVWVAEVMLQQTTSAACVPRYRRFIARFPTVRSLAEADEQEVLSLWEGLGYYSRARYLLRAAKTVVEHHGGHLPPGLKQLRCLPGIGEYTAGAIRAVAFNLPAPMVDANVRRVLGRYCGIPAGRDAAEAEVRRASEAISSAGAPRVVNQAMMELGALVCVPQEPACGECPLTGLCRACAAGSYEWYGSTPRRMTPEPKRELCVVARLDGRWLLSSPRDGRWQGMWEFPRSDMTGQEDPAEAGTALLGETFGVSGSDWAMGATIRHRVTRWDITLHVLRCRLDAEPRRWETQWILAGEQEIGSLPLPSPMRRIARALAGDGRLLFSEAI